MEKRNNENYDRKDRDFSDLDTLIDQERNYSNKNDDDLYQYEEEFIDDVNHQTNDFNRNENIPNPERIINEDDLITNDEEKDSDDDHEPDEPDYENDLEKDGDLDDDDTEEMDDFDAEHYPENHPRE